MPEFLKIDPDDLVEETVEDYSFSAGREFGHILVGMFVAGVVGLAFILNDASKPGPSGDHMAGADGIRNLAIFVVLVLAVSGGYWVWRDVIGKRESGSRINLLQRKFFWWDGKIPAKVNSIDIDTLSKVTFKTVGEDSEDVVLWSKTGQSLQIPYICFRNPRKWARTLNERLPHVVIG